MALTAGWSAGCLFRDNAKIRNSLAQIPNRQLEPIWFPTAALADNLVREHLTRRRGGKRGKSTAKQKGAPPRPPTKAQAPRPGEGGRRGGRKRPVR